MSSQEESGYQLQPDQVNLKEMKDGVGLNFYIELNSTEQINCERMEINVEGMPYASMARIVKYFSSNKRNISIVTLPFHCFE